MDTVWTTPKIKHQLEINQDWLERAIRAIYDRQTAQEQRTEQTIEHNGQGFTGADAPYLTYVATYLQTKHLSGYHVAKARRRMLKYSGQLAKIANGEL